MVLRFLDRVAALMCNMQNLIGPPGNVSKLGTFLSRPGFPDDITQPNTQEGRKLENW
jgi:hypothetical protein